MLTEFFYLNLYTGLSPCSELLANVNLRVPSKLTRTSPILRTRKTCNRHCTLYRLKETYNHYSHNIDLFHTPLRSYMCDLQTSVSPRLGSDQFYFYFHCPIFVYVARLCYCSYSYISISARLYCQIFMTLCFIVS